MYFSLQAESRDVKSKPMLVEGEELMHHPNIGIDSQKKLLEIKGVGPKLASRIWKKFKKRRNAKNPVKLEQIRHEIKGVGRVTIENINEYILLHSDLFEFTAVDDDLL